MEYNCPIPKCPHRFGYTRRGPVTGESQKTYNRMWIAIDKSGTIKLNSRHRFCPWHLKDLYNLLMNLKN
jgi:hypothetical protein